VEVSAEQLLSPVTTDAQIFAQGLNYVAHASEAQHANRKSNLIFTKASSALTGPYGDVVRPSEVQLLDYEVEFGLVLRKDLAEGQEVTDITIGDAVAGVVLCNDVSTRDTMFGASFMQWYRGKSYRTFCPTGPVLWLSWISSNGSAKGTCDIAKTYSKASKARLAQLRSSTAAQTAASSSSGSRLKPIGLWPLRVPDLSETYFAGRQSNYG
jgi:hypothetical protein